MSASNKSNFGRRQFLSATAALGVTGYLGLRRRAVPAEPLPETTRIRIVHAPFICTAPQYLAEDLLPIEGFENVEYIPVGTRSGVDALANDEADVSIMACADRDAS